MRRRWASRSAHIIANFLLPWFQSCGSGLTQTLVKLERRVPKQIYGNAFHETSSMAAQPKKIPTELTARALIRKFLTKRFVVACSESVFVESYCGGVAQPLTLIPPGARNAKPGTSISSDSCGLQPTPLDQKRI